MSLITSMVKKTIEIGIMILYEISIEIMPPYRPTVVMNYGLYRFIL